MRQTMLPHSWIGLVSCLATVMLMSACSTFRSPVVQLDQSVHFVTPAGTDVVVKQGVYRVEQATGSQLRLLPAGEAPPIVIAGEALPPDPDVPGPIAMAIPFEPDVYGLVLLRPDGPGVAAHGSVGGVQSRALLSTSKDAVKGAVTKEELLNRPDLVTGFRWNYCGNLCRPKYGFYWVHNKGYGAAGPSKARYGSDGTAFDVPALEPGKSLTYWSGFITTPACLSADVENAVAESNESNNRWCPGMAY